MFVPEATERLAAEHAELEAAVREGGPEAGVEAWLGGRVDGRALERARAAHRAFFADYAGLASWPVTRRELRSMDVPAVVLHRAVVAAARRGRGRRAGGADAGRAARRRRRPRRGGAHAARLALSGRVTPGAAARCRLREGPPPARRPARAPARAGGAAGGGSAAPAPTAACAAIIAPQPAIELPVQVAPGLSVRVRDPYGGLIARNRLFVAFSVRYRSAADRAPHRGGDVDARRRRPAPRRGRARPAPGAVDDVRGGPARRRGAHPAGRRRPGRRGRAPGHGDRLPARLPVPAARPARRPRGGGRVRRPGPARDRAAARQRALRGAAVGASARSGWPEGARERCAPRR